MEGVLQILCNDEVHRRHRQLLQHRIGIGVKTAVSIVEGDKYCIIRNLSPFHKPFELLEGNKLKALLLQMA
ncbi:hypothetical protein D3C87_1859340 [compost metagenome]